MKAKQMENYLLETYGKVVHDMDNMEYACSELANLHDIKAEDIFFFMVENRPLPISSGIISHNYGFNTREGRALKQQFEKYYYEV
tara:strand:- start:7488 stop:7742 length:255 start_codon:yes stop_codon:yes gene_type:complete